MSRRREVLLALAILLVAANLRPAVVGVAPLLSEIRADLEIGSAPAGLLTSLPVLCFGLLAPVAPRLARQWGLEALLLAALAVLTLGIAVRLVPVFVVLLLGSVLVGAAIAVGNVSLPPLVKRDFPHRTGVMTGAYSMVLTGGGALAAAVTVPFQRATGLDWRWTLGAWGALTLVTLVVWLPQVRRARRAPVPTPGPGPAPDAPGTIVRALRHDRLAWQVTGFMGLQSLHFYAVSAWVPTLFVDAGRTPAQAGLLLSLAGIVGLVFSSLAPVVAMRRPSQGPLVGALCAFYVAGYVGLIVAPGPLGALWMVLLGVAQGSMIALALLLITLRSPDPAHTAELSAMAQGVGYTLAAAGPFGLGALHDLSGGWTVPMVAMLLLTVPLAVVGVRAGRDRHVLRGDAPTERSAPVARAS